MSIGIPRCESRIVEEITAFWNGQTPTNILDQLKEDGPWGVVHSSLGTFPEGTKAVNIYHDRIQIIPFQGEPVETPINWQETNGVLTEGSIKWYVLLCDVMTFAFYKCDAKGIPSTTQHAAIAIALGPPGGIPDEAKTTADEAKETFQKLGINLNIDYDFYY